MEQLEILLTDDQLRIIVDRVAYKKPAIKDVQNHLLAWLKIRPNKKLIDRLYAILIELWHGYDYDSNFGDLRKGITEVYDLLDQIVLKTLCYQGQTYISKIHGFVPNILKQLKFFSIYHRINDLSNSYQISTS
jgi:hypothetical protein